MKQEEALRLHSEPDEFDRMYQERGEKFFCDFFDTFTTKEIVIDIDDWSGEEYEEFASRIVSSEYYVAMSNEQIDDYSEKYFQEYPKELIKVICKYTDDLGQSDSEDYWLVNNEKAIALVMRKESKVKLDKKSMYSKLYRIYSGGDKPHSVFEVRREAMVLKGSTKLTEGEEEACKEIFKEFGGEHE